MPNVLTRLLGRGDASPFVSVVPSLEERTSSLENPATPLAYPAEWLLNWMGGEPTAAGEAVSPETAMREPTVFGCVRVITESISSLPLLVYERLGKGRRPADDTALYQLLAVEPNPQMTAMAFLEAILLGILLRGNGYAEIEWNKAGQPVALWPRDPRHVKPMRTPTGDLVYEIRLPHQDVYTVKSEDMLHIPALAMDGIIGLSPIELGKQAIGLALAAQKYGAHWFGNGSVPAGILSTAEKLSPTAAAEFKASWERAQGGRNANRTAVLPPGTTFSPISTPPDESQFIATREHQRSVICGFFRVAPKYVGDLTRLSNSNSENESLEFVTQTLRPYLVRIEQEFIRKLCPSIGRNAGRYFIRFDVSEFTRGDFTSTSQGYALGRQWGWLSANDVREMEGLNPIGSEGDIYMSPLNMVNAKSLGKSDPEGEPTQDTESEEQDDSVDPAESDQTDDLQRNLIDRLNVSFFRVFLDNIGRICNREKRDLDTISQVFKPVLRTIADESIATANDHLRSAVPTDEAEKFTADALKSIAKRADAWQTDNVYEIAADELRKAILTITLGAFRAAGAHHLKAAA